MSVEKKKKAKELEETGKTLTDQEQKDYAAHGERGTVAPIEGEPDHAPQDYEGREKEVYDLYVEERGSPPPDDWVKLYAGKKYASDDFIRADLKGYIKYEFVPNDKEKYAKAGSNPATYDGKGHWRHTYSQKAVDQMGGKIDISKLAGGTEVIAPKDSLSGDNWKAMYSGADEEAQMDASGLVRAFHMGRPKTGIVGALVGDKVSMQIGSALPDELQAVADLYTLGTGNSLAFGAEGAKDVNNAWRRAGLERAKPVVYAGAKVAATLAATVASGGNPLVGAAVASGMTAAQGAANREAGAKDSWRSIIKNSAVAGGTAYVGGSIGEWARGAQAATQASGTITAAQAAQHSANIGFLATAGQAATGAAGAALSGGDVKASLLSSLASGVVGGDTTAQALTSAGTTYALSKGSSGQRLAQSAFAAGRTAAYSAASGGPGSKLFGGPLTRVPSGWRETIRLSQTKPVDLSDPLDASEYDSAIQAERYMNQEWNPDETL